jgi:nucleoid-associated protein YgaU
MTDQELQQKYQPVADFMSANSFGIAHFNGDNGKCVLEATAPTEHLKDAAWDEIKKIDPNFQDLQHNITVGSGTTYTVQSGDNLSKISKHFYGEANDYQKIADANNIDNPDHIQVGQDLTIPA